MLADAQGLLEVSGNSARRLGEAEFLNHCLEAFTVFGGVDTVDAGADDGRSGRLERPGQIERGLTAELDNEAAGVHSFDDIEDIFCGKGFEKEIIGGVVVG